MGAMMPDIIKTLSFDETEIKFAGDGKQGIFEDMPLYSVIQIQTAISFFQEPTKTRLKNRRAKLRCFLITGNGKFRLVNGMPSKKTVKVFMFVDS
jgi:hypothetical protein